ncbi:hypothetical protein DUNSADRAFT_7828 [Dunaliella salina]|uniref:Uncharacterized protein n=1 Tax=Dunaliella salina TaxID=3046 RepID=A0ABQ7GKM1_DUNSA|nr:hypothetical protein DUNSADRAFT_7828 [Dunaliella salina]|eukprot:KAF5835153.1 hypothetical protein DUNSADRAFT_7828 [Dunaliella salina]
MCKLCNTANCGWCDALCASCAPQPTVAAAMLYVQAVRLSQLWLLRCSMCKLCATANCGCWTLDVQAVQHSQLWLAQGRVHAEQAEYGEALGCWNKALCCDPDNAVLLEEIAQVYLELGLDFEALQAAARATRVAPQMVEAYLTLGRAQLNFGEPQLALGSLEKVLELQPGHPEASEEINHVRVVALKQKRGAEGMRAFVS